MERLLIHGAFAIEGVLVHRAAGMRRHGPRRAAHRHRMPKGRDRLRHWRFYEVGLK